ncbi:MAG: sensor domain-containing diguanylate cyclase [Desulfarculaceae bacterium]|nr:sensor domain-containing diguanylate cyclase [Desulfarculaceae bacterium]MCF8049311.1 sensor domain-containing diguanylate cyclase [Desulfarculaceae bacterium]MCF8066579.1 sensor domain-containing diguanylate cyclase [Desulfarculaceae bacterium]MCF8096734.1 sensor domain-containing diguanylate cyclase [Desulfarculaceae bacterium]MCF8123030.1 sensor domain-containing diguanylate cyclase [Desulfarculaceae bacterium]
MLELGGQPNYDLAPYLQVLDVSESRLTIDQVSTEPWNRHFKLLGGPALESPSRDLRIHWLRFTAFAPKGSVAAKTTWLIATDYVYLDKIDFYRPAPEGWEVVKTGLNRPFATRELANRSFVFTLPQTDKGLFTCYLRLETKGFNPLHFYAWPLPAFISHTTKESYLFAICYGVLLSMIAFNLFIAISLRDRVYLYYVGYILFALVSMTFLHGQVTALWDFGTQTFVTMLWVNMGLFTAFAYLFMRGILNIRSLSPLVDKLLLFGFCYGLSISVAGLMNLPWISRWLTLGSGIFSPWLALTAGIVSLRRGFAAARYFLLAWGVLAAAVAIFVIQELGLIQGEYWARNSLLVGTALESILLSLALAARIRDLKEERRVLAESENRFKNLSYTDGLTGLFNKRFFSLHLEEALSSGQGPNDRPCLLFIDLDDFKLFNDTYGHDQGDLVLQGLAGIITDRVRSNDMPCRWGGEEFAVILLGATLESAAAIAERIRQSFAQYAFSPNGQTVRQTLSVGLARAQQGESSAEFIRRADQALYRAKRAGKNQLYVSAVKPSSP